MSWHVTVTGQRSAAKPGKIITCDYTSYTPFFPPLLQSKDGGFSDTVSNEIFLVSLKYTNQTVYNAETDTEHLLKPLSGSFEVNQAFS